MSIDICSLSTDVWLMYKIHFAFVQFLNVVILQTEEHQDEVNEFSAAVLHELNTLNHTFKVEEKLLVNYETTTSLDINIREGYFICVWNIKLLKTFLSRDYRLVVPNPRAVYTILVIFHPKCDTVLSHFNHILNQLWTKYNAAKVTILTPCSCGGTNIYIYHPFDFRNGTWGTTQSFTIKDILKDSKLLMKRRHDMNHFPVRISLFIREPSVLKKIPNYVRTNTIYRNLHHSKGFAGVDAFILGTIAQKFNFDAVIVENVSDEPFGRILPNGTAIGTLADVMNKKVQLSANARFLKDYNTKEVEFTTPYSSDQLCMVVPKASEIPIWKKMLNCFTLSSWTLIFMSSFVYTIVWYFIGPHMDFLLTVSQMFALLVGIPRRLSPSNTQLVFLIFCLVFNVIIFGIIQGSFVTEYTTVSFYKDIDTLEELYESNLPIATNYWFLVEDDQSDITTRLREHMIPVTEDPFDQTAFKGNIATLNRRQDQEFMLITRHRSQYGLPLVHIVSECFSTILLAYIVPKGSPFLEGFNWVILRLFEAGFTDKWTKDVLNGFQVEEAKTLAQQGHPDFATLYDMQMAFRLLIIGYLVSFCVLTLEILVKCSTQIKH